MLLERADLRKTPYRRLLTTNTTAKLQSVEPRLWISQLKAPPDIWLCANVGDHESNQPGREAAAIMVGYSLLRGLRTFLSTPSLSGPSTHVLWAILRPGKRMLLSQGLTRVWRSYSSVHHKLHPDAQSNSFSGANSAFSLSYQDRGSISPSLVDNPQAEGLLHLGTGWRKGHQHKNNWEACRSWHFPSWASD